MMPDVGAEASLMIFKQAAIISLAKGTPFKYDSVCAVLSAFLEGPTGLFKKNNAE